MEGISIADLEHWLDESLPFLLVVAGMVAMCWIADRYFIDANSKTLFTSTYFGGAAAVALYNLLDSGSLASIADFAAGLDDRSKYMASVVLVTMSYFMTTLFVSPASGKTRSKAVIDNLCPASKAGVPGNFPSTLSDDPTKLFVEMCDVLIKENIAELVVKYEAIPEQIKWVQEMLEYNVKGGKMNRGLGVLDVLKAFAEAQGREISKRELCQASILGWCIEWLQAFFLVADDVMDASLTRRGQPCWYKQEKVKLIAINDSFILESLVFMNLKRHFGSESYYLQMNDLFREVTYQTEMGQLLDLTSQPMHEPPELTRFTKTRYNMIVKYKTAFYTFYLPCAIGMIYAGVKEVEAFDLAREICCSIGTLFQIQDDVLDCYGDPEKIGKVGTDIQDNKCSWLVVQALEKADEEQKALLIEQYGKDNEECIAKVKALYVDLKLKEHFEAYEEAEHKRIKGLISQVKGVPPGIFNMFIDRIYKRQK